MENQTKKCQVCAAHFEVTSDNILFYQKIDVPAPEACPRCRQQNRIAFRNFKTLYKRNSDKSGKSMITMYSDKVPFPVWTREEWYGDDWDPTTYAKDIDWDRPFLHQVKELWEVVPQSGIFVNNSVQCEYTNAAFNSKNCYLVFGCVENEDCSYGHIVWNCRNSFDNLYVNRSEDCYECVDVLDSNNVSYSQESEGCVDSIGLFDCKSLTNCIGCVGLRGKSYHIFNEQVTKEEYTAFLKQYPLHRPESIQYILGKQIELRKKLPQRHFFGSNNTDVSGNHIYNGKNLHHCFDVQGGENSSFVYTSGKVLNSYEISFSPETEHSYEALVCLKSRNIFFSKDCLGSSDIYYSENCLNSQDLIGCIGLRKKQYCILNKQYSKEEYEELKPKVIAKLKEDGAWGKFFPMAMSPFCYNESIANEYMPITKEEILAKGWRFEEDIPATSGSQTKEHYELPSDPEYYVVEALSKEVLKCGSCERNYRLTPQEIQFYKAKGLALPKECFNCPVMASVSNYPVSAGIHKGFYLWEFCNV